jgi:hypothetical protein
MRSLFKSTSTRRYIKNKLGEVVAIAGWGYYTCTFCNQKVIAYNDERHANSQKHKKNIKVYEKKNGVTVIENIDKIENLEALLREKKLI